jgi:pimeloyl-ACP methyl ester carboxylesterase
LCVAGDLGTVVFLHGFPEIWYSWRHQMLAVAAAGYRAIAPDCRGYGLSDQPPEDEEGPRLTTSSPTCSASSTPSASRR